MPTRSEQEANIFSLVVWLEDQRCGGTASYKPDFFERFFLFLVKTLPATPPVDTGLLTGLLRKTEDS
jgi:hypothetical protein